MTTVCQKITFKCLKSCFLLKTNAFHSFSSFRKKLIQVFCCKNAKNDYFDQRLECAKPKRWSKYTTHVIWQTLIKPSLRDQSVNIRAGSLSFRSAGLNHTGFNLQIWQSVPNFVDDAFTNDMTHFQFLSFQSNWISDFLRFDGFLGIIM